VTLAEALQLEGATTAAWSANPLVVPEKNFDQGFELFDSRNEFRKSELLEGGDRTPSWSAWATSAFSSICT
jgi:hypothetical protein